MKYTIDELSEQVITDRLLSNQKDVSYASVIDIGAAPPPNYYEIFMRHTNHVYCVEPALSIKDNPYKRHVLKLQSYALLKRVCLFHGVISDIDGMVKFHQGKGNTINSSLNPDFRLDYIQDAQEYTDSFKEIQVASLTYGSYLLKSDIHNLFMVKIDAEGAEGKVLTAMENRNAPQILLLEVAYDTGILKEQVARLFNQGVFTDSLFIIKKTEAHNSDIIGDYRFNEHEKWLNSDPEFTSGSLFLARPNCIDKTELLELRKEIRAALSFAP